MEKVIFISGFMGGKKDILGLRIMLRHLEWIYFPYNTNLVEPIEKIAKKLKNFIDSLKLKKGDRLSIVALSAGGIISEYYLKFLDHKKIRRLVTIASPFGGSYLANIFPTDSGFLGLRQLRVNSNFLDKLKRKEFVDVKVKNIWCWLDPLVPGESAKGVNPKHTLFFLHWIIQYWPPVIQEVKKFLEK